MEMAVIMMRLDKFLVEMGAGSRSEVKKQISKGLVLVNGIVVRKPEMKIQEQEDVVMFSGKEYRYEAFVYYMLHKPAGVISATEDRKDKTVLDLIPDKKRPDIFPVGRLDKDTEGLLLLTNDGQLAHRLLSPKKHVDKTYEARISGIVTEEDIREFRTGLDIGDEKPTLPANLEILYTDPTKTESYVSIVIREGRFHQIKRMFEAVGKEVLYLKRIRMGSLVLDTKLLKGESRELTPEEVKMLINETGGEHAKENA